MRLFGERGNLVVLSVPVSGPTSNVVEMPLTDDVNARKSSASSRAQIKG